MEKSSKWVIKAHLIYDIPNGLQCQKKMDFLNKYMVNLHYRGSSCNPTVREINLSVDLTILQAVGLQEIC